MKSTSNLTPLLVTGLTSGLLLAACGGGGSSSSSSNSVSLPTTPPTAASPTLMSNIEFTQAATQSGSIPLLLDIYQPDASCPANRPTVLFVHGGGFVSGDKASAEITLLADAVIEKDMNFVSIQYRLFGDSPVLSAPFQAISDAFLPFTPTSDQILLDAAVAATEDTVTALTWMEENADEFCLDTTNLTYWGYSAGAITVLQVAYGLNEFGITRPEPKVVVDYAGDLFRDTDIEFRDSPLFILHGNDDDIVPYNGALELEAQATDVGVPFAFYTVDGGGHVFDVTAIESNGLTLLEQTINFVEAHLIGGLPDYVTVTVAE